MVMITFNRTNLELKLMITFKELFNIFTFNRTNLELKPSSFSRARSLYDVTFNRTNLELKRNHGWNT